MGNRISKAAAREDELAGEVSHAKAALLPLQLQVCMRAYAKCMALFASKPPPPLQLEKAGEEAALLRTLRTWHEGELQAKQEALLELRRTRASESAEASAQVRQRVRSGDVPTQRMPVSEHRSSRLHSASWDRRTRRWLLP